MEQRLLEYLPSALRVVSCVLFVCFLLGGWREGEWGIQALLKPEVYLVLVARMALGLHF